ncbi:MAG: hypothetical protein JF585_06440 [Burkholderiales bacterium]|nr:hypothetical protein [Burkholderiales bacterium]
MDLPFQDLWLPALRNRTVLFANHVLTGCPPAVERLRAHAGKAVRVDATGWPGLIRVDATGWPGLIPVPPPLTLRITPAGLFECSDATDLAAVVPDLDVRIDASDPAKFAGNLLKGALPPMSIDGDGALAADVNWIAQNVRWDPAADAERFFGPTLAEAVSRANEQFSQVGEKVKSAMGQLFDQFQARKKS